MFDSMDCMPLDDYSDRDYAAEDAEFEQRWRWLKDQASWLTEGDVLKLMSREDFPGLHADYGVLNSFMDKVKAKATRKVNCRLQMDAFTITGMMDLVSGAVFIPDNGRYVMADFSGYMTCLFETPKRAARSYRGHGNKVTTVSGIISNGVMKNTSYDVSYLVQVLEEEGTLPSL